MNRGIKLINCIREYFSEARKLMPEVTDKMLYTEETDETIFYMNGNDGTEFDWGCNGRLCEFFMFYKSTEMGFIKVYINDDDTISGYIYKEDYHYGDKPNKLEVKNLHKGDAKYLATLMNEIADKRNLFDQSIDKLQIGYDLKQYQIDDFYPEEEEEEEDWLYED